MKTGRMARVLAVVVILMGFRILRDPFFAEAAGCVSDDVYVNITRYEEDSAFELKAEKEEVSVDNGTGDLKKDTLLVSSGADKEESGSSAESKENFSRKGESESEAEAMYGKKRSFRKIAVCILVVCATLVAGVLCIHFIGRAH